MRPNDKKRWRLMLLLPVVLLTACATTSPPSVPVCPVLPDKPLTVTPMPQVSYSLNASKNILIWQNRLMGTLEISKP